MDNKLLSNDIEIFSSKQEAAASTSSAQNQYFNNPMRSRNTNSTQESLNLIENRYQAHNHSNALSHSKHISFESFSNINTIFSESSVDQFRKRPYRTISHCGFLPPIQSLKPMDFHYPSLVTKYLPLKRSYSTDELFSTSLYIPYPDQLVPKLFKYKKNLQEKFRENCLLFEQRLRGFSNIDEHASNSEPPAKRNRLNQTIVDEENVLIAQSILMEIMDKVYADTNLSDIITALPPANNNPNELQVFQSLFDPPIELIPNPERRKVLSRDVRLQRKAQFMEFWQENDGNDDDAFSSFSSVASEVSQKHSKSKSFSILTEREQKLLSEINESQLDQEEEIFAQIRDSILSKVTFEELAGDGSWHEPDLPKSPSSPLSVSRTFVTSTPTNKHQSPSSSNEKLVSGSSRSTRRTTRIIEPKEKSNLYSLPMTLKTKNEGMAKAGRVNVKVNITKTRVVPAKKTFDSGLSRSGSNCGRTGRRNFVLENIRKASSMKPKSVKSGAIPKEKVDSYRSMLLPKNSFGGSEPKLVHANKIDSAPVRSFEKAKSATGSPNLWITMKPNK